MSVNGCSAGGRASVLTAGSTVRPCPASGFGFLAPVALLGLLGLRIFEATGADITDLGEEHGHRVLRVCGKGTKTVLIPLPPAVGRAIDRAIGPRSSGPILRNTRGARMDRHAATRRLRRLAETAGVRITRPHPHMLRHTFVTTMLDAGVDLRDVQIAGAVPGSWPVRPLLVHVRVVAGFWGCGQEEALEGVGEPGLVLAGCPAVVAGQQEVEVGVCQCRIGVCCLLGGEALAEGPVGVHEVYQVSLETAAAVDFGGEVLPERAVGCGCVSEHCVDG